MDLGALPDNRGWYDKWQFSEDLYLYQKLTAAD